MKKWRGLGIFALGLFVGICVSFAPELQAASSKLLGGKVGNVLSVKLDGKYIGDGGVIGGTTYVPLRTVSNNLGAEVVKVNKNEVVLSTGPDPSNVNMDKINAQRDEIISQIRILNVKAERARSTIKQKDMLLKNIQDLDARIEVAKRLMTVEGSGYTMANVESLEQSKIEIENRLKEAETNLPLWEKEIADLETQLAALK